jgi:hypothetical protein
MSIFFPAKLSNRQNRMPVTLTHSHKITDTMRSSSATVTALPPTGSPKRIYATNAWTPLVVQVTTTTEASVKASKTGAIVKGKRATTVTTFAFLNISQRVLAPRRAPQWRAFAMAPRSVTVKQTTSSTATRAMLSRPMTMAMFARGTLR